MVKRLSQIDIKRMAYWVGLCLRGVVLGLLLSYALYELWAQTDNVTLFRYQNF